MTEAIRVDPATVGLGKPQCDWYGCERASSAARLFENLKPVQSPVPVDVELAFCAHHWREAARTGRVHIDWERILEARAKDSDA